MAQRVILDTDIGGDIDDALALAMAKGTPDLDLVGVTTVYGKVRERALLAARLLRALGDDTTPVAAGIGRPERQPVEPDPIEAQFLAIVGDRPAPPWTDTPGVELIRAAAEADPGGVTLVAIGPLTNVAALVRQHPAAASKLKEVVLMGAGFRTGAAEWNIKLDAGAARTVFSSGLPLRVVPFDLTYRAMMPTDQLERLYRETRPGQYMLARLVHLWQGGYGFGSNPCLHDPLALGCLLAPDLYTFEAMDVEVVTEAGPDRGMTLGRPNAHGRTRVATAVDYGGFFDLFAEAVFAEFPAPVLP